MRIALALVVVAVTGCSLFTTRAPSSSDPTQTCNASDVGPALDAAWAVVGVFSALAILEDQYNDDRYKDAAIVGGFTALFAGAAAYGFSNTGKCRRRTKELLADERAREQLETSQPTVPNPRNDAWQMTKQAQLAARSGDCPTVFALDEVVRGMDAEFHRSVFSRDAGIISCMSTKEITVAPPSEATPQVSPPAPPPAPPPGAN